MTISSCSLKEQPYGFYSDDNFFKTIDDAQSSLLYAYNALTFLEYSRGIFYLGDIPTETMSPKSDEAGDVYQLENWIANANTEQLEYYFKYCNISINRANTVINHLDGSDKFPQEERDRILGEAYFLKSWSMFNLVRNFGLVPFDGVPVKTMDKAYDSIIGNTRKAEGLLKLNKVAGCADKVAAQSLLAKVYLTIASAKENHCVLYSEMTRNVKEMYDSSAFWAGKVVNDYKESYSLDPDLKHIYDVEAVNGPEHIFIMSQDRSGTQEGNYSKLPLMFLPSNNSVPFYIKYSDGSLQKANGNGWGVFLCCDEFVETQFRATDKRRTELIHRSIYDANGNAIVPNQIRGYFTSKYVDPDFVGERTSAHPYLIRYSDILLVYAEALGPAEGLQYVNAVRQRAGIEALPGGLSTDEFRKLVIKERALELAFEGNRLYDLRRTGTVTATDYHAAGLSEAQTAFFPIPQREIDLNPNLQ